MKNSNPINGIASHPLYGFGNIRNVDVQTNPGSVKLNNKLLGTTSPVTINHGYFTWIVRDQVPGLGGLYAVDSTNRVYFSSTGSGWTQIGDGTAAGAAGNGVGTGQGLAIWKNYLFSVGTNGVAVYGPLGGVTTWTRAFQTLTTVTFTISNTNNFPFNQAFASIDGNLYIANQNHVHKISENTPPFAPGTAASSSVVANAITIGSQYNISCMADLGQYLMLGTKIVADADTIYEQGADIFPYDRATLTLGVPIKIPDNGVQMMISIKNRLYFLAGRQGRLYISDTASYEEIAKVPDYLYSQEGNMFTLYPGAIMYAQGKIYFGLGAATTGTNLGVWSYRLVSRALQIENTISTGNDGANGLYITALFPVGRKEILVAFEDNITTTPAFGCDYQVLGTYTKYTGYLGYVESALMKVGEVLGDRTVGNLEVALVKPLTTGQGVRIKWRKNLSDAWTTLGTVDFATFGATQGQNLSAATMTNLTYLQMRVELESNNTTSPELQSLILHPSEA